MDALAGLLQVPLGPGHWLIIAGGVLIVLGALGLMIRRSRRAGSEVEDEVTPDASLNRIEASSERADHRPSGRDPA
jgi:Sec-independent protein translocase protein TatA